MFRGQYALLPFVLTLSIYMYMTYVAITTETQPGLRIATTVAITKY